jgi:hypothetical protein
MVLPESQCDPQVLSTVLGFSDVHRREWDVEDLKAMLRHQLGVPLYLSLGTLSAEVSHELGKWSPEHRLMTLGQLLQHDRPPLEVLKLIKRFAKMCRSDRDNPLQSEIVMLMYYVSIVTALVRLNQPISVLPPASLKRGLSWLSAQPWMDDEVHVLLNEGLSYLNSRKSGAEEMSAE